MRAIREKGESKNDVLWKSQKNALTKIGVEKVFFDGPKVKWGLNGPLLRF